MISAVSSFDPVERPDINDRFFNRELSWLSFNERVLAEATRPSYPLLERLRFLAISGSNLDEFMMIRVAGLSGQVRSGVDEVSIDGKTPQQQVAAVRSKIGELVDMQQRALAELRALLDNQGIHIVDERHMDSQATAWLRQYFIDYVVPVVTPQAIDPAHPFPFVANQGIGVLFSLTRIRDGARLVEMVLIPNAIPRFVRIPGDEATYVSIESVICRFADLLFPGFQVEGDGVFRVLRDSDIELEEEAEDLVRYFRTAIQRRRRGRVILMEIDRDCAPEAEAILREQLALPDTLVNKTDGMLGIGGLAGVVEEDRPDLKFEPFNPRYPERILEHDGDCFAAIREKDMIIHHPYESFEAVVDFIRQAAKDPSVVSIKQTLYRAGNQSSIIAALITAAESGKSVTAVVELKARFDEEQNLHWASELERAGVQVIYGFIDWKTHAKVSMIVRREEQAYRTYCHFGTGNYHPQTARIYTDFSYFTADESLARDAVKLFNFITGYVEPQRTEQLSISPINLRETLYGLIDKEIANAEAGKPAAIWAKLNSLTDSDMIDRLYEASRAGVEIRLVVRGICCLKPGVPGLSETISVKSIVGRFLEHARIWAFANGHALPSRRAKVYISSADAMSRNLDRRVETLVPIRNATVHDQILDQVMVANFLDTEQSWALDSGGNYHRIENSDHPFNCHRYFMTNPSLSGRGAALSRGGVPRLDLRRGRE
ncbi:RNA degradosome polyphosphate kinase [Altererythrobacter sp. Root672]|uniref:RNA degradosome polyphosphate kinase n=1 Tax=Altererythrobacter sp. Root672 TaxID=1736584 RepID=UPI0006FF124F|nr:RNA degradosome polyphosphate kinase [Altererythrobacter sp. Root672]KRA81619.1 polyphosphate kinase [Altererythrobacter sp. Root672]